MESNEGLESAVEETNEQETCASEAVESIDREILGYLSEDSQQVLKVEGEESRTNKKEKPNSFSGKVKYGLSDSGITENISSELAKLVRHYNEASATEGTHNDKKEGTNRGAAAIIYNKETGEFYLELKPSSYPIKEARGKLALVGGKVEPSDPTSLDALIREIQEEVVNKKAQEILIDRVTQLGSYYRTIVEIVNGIRYETDIYKINVDSDKEWNIVKNSPLAEGKNQTLTFQEIRGRFGDFAFKYDEALNELIEEEYGRHHHRKNDYSLAWPMIGSTHYNTQSNISVITLPKFYTASMAMR